MHGFVVVTGKINAWDEMWRGKFCWAVTRENSTTSLEVNGKGQRGKVEGKLQLSFNLCRSLLLMKSSLLFIKLQTWEKFEGWSDLGFAGMKREKVNWKLMETFMNFSICLNLNVDEGLRIEKPFKILLQWLSFEGYFEKMKINFWKKTKKGIYFVGWLFNAKRKVVVQFYKFSVGSFSFWNVNKMCLLLWIFIFQ